MQIMTEALLEAGRGLIEDHYSRFDGDRQVTLIESENLSTIASHLGKGEVMPQDLRRNLVTQGINLLAFKDRHFRIGQAILETSGECHPCSRMEEVLGVGGYSAVRGLGGIIARVVRGGRIQIGDVVEPLYIEIEL
jgi:MOSC domain-containing protein YiiM